MGSLCGGNTQTTTSQQSTTPTNLAGLQSVFGQVQNAAQTPFTAFTGESVAPVNDQQRAGIAGINASATAAQPYYSKAADLAFTSGAPISPDAIQHYQSPFTQSVIDATKANFAEDNGQAQQALKAKAAMAGALGGSGQGVAQAELVRQQQLAQAPVIANLEQQGYTQALQAAQADRGAAGNAAGTFSNIGTAAQRAGIEGAGAQISAGTLEQQTQQQKDAADYRDYLQRLAFPYQNAQFFAQYGLPAAVAQGSSTSGTQTAPGPSLFAQLAGLGIAGAGVASKFAADGGRIEFADGGSPFNFINDVHGYVPVGGNAPQVSLPQTQLKFADTKQPDMSPITTALSGIGKGTFRNPFASSGSGGWGATDTGAEGVGSLGGLYSHGGLVEAINHIHHTIKRSRGGAVIDVPFSGYAKGGRVRTFADGGGLDDRFGAVQEALADGTFDAAGKNSTTFDVPPAPFRLSRSAAVSPDDAPSMIPLPQPNPMRTAALPPQITGAPQDDTGPSSALAFDRTAPAASPLSLVPQGEAEQPAQAAQSRFGISPKAGDALIATGLGMMASRSPFALSAIGEGGLHGLKNYSDATAAEREAADKKITQGQNQKRIDFEAQRIAQSASQFAKTQGLAERRQKLAEDKTPEGYRATKDGNLEPIPNGPADPETIRKAAEAKREFKPAWGVIEEDPLTGKKVYGWIDPNEKTTTRPAPVEGSPKTDGPIPPTLSGPEYMSELEKRNPEFARTVKAVGDYRASITSLSQRGGLREKILEAAARYNPDYDQTQFAGRNRAVTAFSAGPEGRTVRSLNVAIDHLNTLDEAAKALHNGDYPTLNKVVNYFKEKSGSPVTTNFDSIKQVVSAEVAKAVVGGQTALHDRDDMAQRASNAKSPEQLSGIITEFKKLMAGQMKGLRRQYETSTRLKNFDDFLEPQTKKELDALSGKEKPEAQVSDTGLVEGRTGTDASGRKVIVKGGKVVPL